MKIVVKLGDTLLDVPESRYRVAREVAAAAGTGTLAVVHGGGKQMTAYLAARGVESKFVDGLRVTTPEVVDAVLKVFAGSVNHELVAALVAAGAPAVGISGIDAGLAQAEQLKPELGAVGRVVRSNARILETLTSNGFLPVIACVAGGPGGAIFNVNADQMAVACAAAFGADTLLFLTDVEGVRNASGATAATLTPEQCGDLISAGVATGGMQAKLNAAVDALRQGVGEVVIAPGARENIISAVLSGASAGTRIVPAPVEAAR